MLGYTLMEQVIQEGISNEITSELKPVKEWWGDLELSGIFQEKSMCKGPEAPGRSLAWPVSRRKASGGQGTDHEGFHRLWKEV